MDERLPMATETPDECRRRIMQPCREQWADESPIGASLRQTWGDRARALNRRIKISGSVVPTLTSHSRNDASLVPAFDQGNKTKIQQLVPISEADGSRVGFGPCGLGDTRYAIKEGTVHEVESSTNAFVKTFSNQWKTRSGGMVETSTTLPNRTIKLGCHQHFGFCIKEIHNMALFTHIKEQLRQFVSNHRRLHLVKGKNAGPNLAHQLPLLIMKPKSDAEVASSSDSRSPGFHFLMRHKGEILPQVNIRNHI